MFTMTMTEAESMLVEKGKYYLDIQEVNGVTHVWGQVIVDPHVTVMV